MPAILIPDPSWPVTSLIYETMGFDKIIKIPYYDKAKNCINFGAVTNCIKSAPEGSILLLEACAQNPTGVDPTKE